jgi:hypothetical protein
MDTLSLLAACALVAAIIWSVITLRGLLKQLRPGHDE